MKRIIAATALALSFASASVVALMAAHPARASFLESSLEPGGQDNGQIPVQMSLSGSAEVTQIILQTLASGATDVTLAGNGSLGTFTYHELNTSSAAPSGTCGGPNFPKFTVMAGAGVFRFQDGALLTTNITNGSICVDLNIREATVSVAYQITGGTGRFENASGTLAFTAKSDPLLFDTSGKPVFFVVHDGQATGTIVLSPSE